MYANVRSHIVVMHVTVLLHLAQQTDGKQLLFYMLPIAVFLVVGCGNDASAQMSHVSSWCWHTDL